jgi:hypothetical protein
MFIATLLAILFSAFAFGFSLYTLWVVRVSPYRLLAYPPALAYLNRKESSLVLDLTFFNPGRVRVAVLDMEITLWSKDQQGMLGKLKPQAYHQTLFPQGSFPEQHSVISRFAPFMINQQETISKTVYFAAVNQDSGAVLRSGNDQMDRISIAFKINSRWNKKTFGLDYAEFQAFQHDKERSTLLNLPFSPSFSPDAKPLDLRGSIFDPVF